MGDTCIGHCKVPELHGHMWNRGYHGNICLESYNADCSFSDAVGMLIAWCSVFEAVSVRSAHRSEFFRPEVCFRIMTDESVYTRGVVVPLGVEVEEGIDAGSEFRSGAVSCMYSIILSGREVGEDVSVTVVTVGGSRVGIGIYGELLAN